MRAAGLGRSKFQLRNRVTPSGKAGPKQVYIAMHGNGRKWAASSLPKLAPVTGYTGRPRGIVALAADDVRDRFPPRSRVIPGRRTGPGWFSLRRI